MFLRTLLTALIFTLTNAIVEVRTIEYTIPGKYIYILSPKDYNISHNIFVELRSPKIDYDFYKNRHCNSLYLKGSILTNNQEFIITIGNYASIATSDGKVSALVGVNKVVETYGMEVTTLKIDKEYYCIKDNKWIDMEDEVGGTNGRIVIYYSYDFCAEANNTKIDL